LGKKLIKIKKKKKKKKKYKKNKKKKKKKKQEKPSTPFIHPISIPHPSQKGRWKKSIKSIYISLSFRIYYSLPSFLPSHSPPKGKTNQAKKK
jgi:hypothetical protein